MNKEDKPHPYIYLGMARAETIGSVAQESNLSPKPETPTIDKLRAVIHLKYGVDVTVKTKRIRGEVKCRQIYSFIVYLHFKYSYQHIGDLLGGYDHATIKYNVKKVSDLMEVERAYKAEVQFICDKLNINLNALIEQFKSKQ